MKNSGRKTLIQIENNNSCSYKFSLIMEKISHGIMLKHEVRLNYLLLKPRKELGPIRTKSNKRELLYVSYQDLFENNLVNIFTKKEDLKNT